MRISSNASIGLSFFLLAATSANAGVFNMPRFVDPGNNAFGFEPEIMMSNGGGLGANLRYTQGVNELSNAFAVLGTGTNVRTFRVGGGFTLDFIPDVETQPGIGIGFQGIYYRYKPGFGRLETAVVPYIHKMFGNGKGGTVEPFIALPVGPSFASGNYQWTTQLALGAIFHEEKSPVRFIGEIGVNLNNTESYVSGGVLYQP